MDWANDNATCCQDEASKVFKYHERPTTVIRVVPGLAEPLVWTMNKDDDWNNWFETEHPRLGGSQSGLVLILARRSGEPKIDPVKGMESNDWIKRINQVTPDTNNADALCGTGDQKPLRNLPFSEKMFRRIAEEFHIHDSIIRAVSRADVSNFSGMNVQMGQRNGQSLPAQVYNIRTSGVWESDLAASTTHFPRYNLTFSIMFGCTLSVEADILTRLGRTTFEMYHPLLVSSLIVELERKRHLFIVEDTIKKVEARALELDNDPGLLEGVEEDGRSALRKTKRAAWLDMRYLRNQLLSWSNCLGALDKEASRLNRQAYRKPFSYQYEGTESFSAGDDSSTETDSDLEDSFSIWPSIDDTQYRTAEQQDSRDLVVSKLEPYSFENHGSWTPSSFYLKRTGIKIRGRLQEIMKDYNEKIQECTSVVEGMVMSTQWAQGETNVEIGLATSQYSRHMRSMALVTMLFLPGTFVATIFSMGFFDFESSTGSVVVSKLIWLYVVLAIALTGLMVGVWYYHAVYRHKKHRGLRSGSSQGYLSGLRLFDLRSSRKTE
ncbi:uncharacterized protein B0J16DRAFT_181133 [Fusarium flagelliforme]|uniref:Uncharacterized protein n=1 Tax=Fusarium flagelliforme TaxID=2675880 RepID=A0A395MN59_9HYPO|nr:uncharacterized protein B0J16DRAFT_181133 [Fusarium flagelliforme]KAH7174316.1 hypothetical protein B0J16DRAFT_181133 [Fusarium flagelliforme]RFN49015.1 hypothetical protein FIE12Z_6655 [Fusarium flagelliforme]